MQDKKNIKNRKHVHKGKSSESLLDKSTILEELNIRSGQTILDAGCGDGYMTIEFANKTGTTGRVYALDPDSTAIDSLKSQTKGGIIEAIVGDITVETELDECSIDLIYLATVIHGFSEDQIPGFLKETKRLLKPNGRLAIVEIIKEETPFGPPMDIRLSPEELRQQVPLKPIATVIAGQYFYMQIFEN